MPLGTLVLTINNDSEQWLVDKKNQVLGMKKIFFGNLFSYVFCLTKSVILSPNLYEAMAEDTIY